MPGLGGSIRYRVLGPLGAEGVARLPAARQQRLLLAALIAALGRPVARRALVELVWDGEGGADPERALAVLVARLRRALADGEHTIEHTASGYRLVTTPDEVDAGVLAAAAARPDSGPAELEAALALWQGPPFGELGTAGALAPIARGLAAAHALLTGRLHDHRLAAGEAATVLPELARWAEAHPGDEAAWCRYARGLGQLRRTGEALRALHALRTTLRGESGLEPSAAVAALEHDLLTGGHDARLSTLSRARLPRAAAPIVGRADEVAALIELVASRPLVTVVGPGGVGKTRLALEVAGGAAGTGPEGVQWCDLAPVVGTTAALEAVATSCGAALPAGPDRLGAITHTLAPRRGLLVLDNCEHVLDAARAVAAAVVARCPGVAVLATSRQPLDVPGEVVVRLAPLAVTQPDGAPGPAVELFRRHARDLGHPVAEDPATAAEVVEVCRRLDGLPLALEVAAARTTALTPRQIAARLHDVVDTSPPTRAAATSVHRHHSLRAALDFSYALLEPDDQRLFARLGVFSGHFGLDAAEGTCAGPGGAPTAVLDGLERLVDRSLVVATDGRGTKRFGLLDTLRRYAGDHLDRAGETERQRARHADWYTALAARAAREGRGALALPWQERLEDDFDDLEAAFEHHLRTGAVAAAQAMVAAVFTCLSLVGHHRLQASWAPRALALAPSEISPSTATTLAVATWAARADGATAWPLAERALAAIGAGADDDGAVANVVAVLPTFTLTHLDRARAIAAAEVGEARRAGDEHRLVRALCYRGFTRSRAEVEQRVREASEAVERADRLGNVHLQAFASSQLAYPLRLLRDPAAWERGCEAARLAAIARTPVILAHSLQLLGALAHDAGRPEDALAHFLGALTLWRDMDDSRVWQPVHQIAAALHDLGREQAAIALFAAVAERNLGAQVPLRHDVLEATLAQADHERSRAAAAERGRLLSRDEVVALAQAEATATIGG